MLENVTLVPYYQKIVAIERAAIHAYEATIKGVTSDGEYISPLDLFKKAHTMRNLTELDNNARSVAIQHASSILEDALLFLNCHSYSIRKGRLFDEVDSLEIPFKRIVMEMTEQEPIPIYEAIHLLTPYREEGMGVAIDDFGVGFANFELVTALEPDYIKLDRSLIDSVEYSDQAKRVIDGLVAFAYKTNVRVIAEGIERKSQLTVLRQLGIEFGQGYLLGRPFAAEDFAEVKVTKTFHYSKVGETR